ncbi:hypothetical protein GCM10012279_02710 [Micromonospora yangpuensis]|uniref:Uncharacterized protein YjbI, contains pentapeptide repeats n=1 Tax=Micromonospora yangpuensis TaxID=683228 RepID=A0A1C6U968_9ACTN|nr:hypothetical protein GCM10012279_02710 [Micromonospora yangpuensis]SCL50645.1 Uncharacterized protein YjbI, contains pentapeptide repeats [Micromonospora yangpuensis]
MRTTTVGDVTILLPDLDPADLDPTTDLADDVSDALVEDAGWRRAVFDDVRVRGSRIVGVDLSESTWDTGTVFGCEIIRTDLSGAVLSGVTIERCTISGSRLTGARLTDVRLKDVLFDSCRLDYATLDRVVAAGAVGFVDCILADGTWASCRLPHTTVRSCRVDRLELRSCHLTGTDLRGNNLRQVRTSLDSLRGVVLDEHQLPDLTHLAVTALGITGGTCSAKLVGLAGALVCVRSPTGFGTTDQERIRDRGLSA